MAKHDKETYESYAKDMFDNPPAGPMGVHRGARSMASRALPYVIVVIVALLAGLLFWGVYSGEISNVRMPWSAKEDFSSSVSTADKADKKTDDTSKDAKTENKKSEDGKKTSTSDGQSKDASDANQNAEQNNDQNNGQDAASEQSVNLATEIRVVNATSITGYAKSKADALTQAGYTSVTPSNPTGNVPSQTVVWYQNEADKATAENVAQTLGISNVQRIGHADCCGAVELKNAVRTGLEPRPNIGEVLLFSWKSGVFQVDSMRLTSCSQRKERHRVWHSRRESANLRISTRRVRVITGG